MPVEPEPERLDVYKAAIEFLGLADAVAATCRTWTCVHAMEQSPDAARMVLLRIVATRETRSITRGNA